MIHGSWRVGRGAVVGLAIGAIAVVAHVAAGGQIGELLSPKFLCLSMFGVPFAIVLSQREWTLPRLFLTLGLAQIAIHMSMQVRLFAPSSAMSASAPHGSMPGMTMHAMQAGTYVPGLVMFFSHAAAVLVTALLLRRGEKWALALRERLARVFTFTLTFPLNPFPVAVHSAVTVVQARVRGSLLLVDVISRRGPPVLAGTF